MSSTAPRILIGLAFLAYVSLGLPDGVLGIAWPFMRQTFHRPLSDIGFLLVSSTIGYVVASALGGQAVRSFGIGTLLVGSSVCVAVALGGFAWSPIWMAMCVFAVFGGVGAGAIDAGLNAFAAARFSPRVVNWLHASWGIGATAGPLMMTAVVSSHAGWRIGYAVLCGLLSVLTLLFLSTLKRWANDHAATGKVTQASMVDALRRPIVWVHVVLFIAYAGVEATAGQLLFTLFTESRGISVATAGLTVSLYWGALTTGRIVFGQLSASLGQHRLLRIGTLLAPTAAIFIAWNPTNALGLAGAVLLGFAISPIFPTLISLTPARVGSSFAAHAVGFQVSAASVGIAFCPTIAAWIARQFGLEAIELCIVAAAVLVLALQELSMAMTRGRHDPAPVVPV